MMAHKIQPSKSSFSFALRACSFLRDGEQAVKVIRGAQSAGTATAFMYNSTLVLLDNMKRNDMALKVLRDILSIGAVSDVSSTIGAGASNVWSSAEEEDTLSATSSNGHTQISRMRMPPGWLTRRIISGALQNLTENFATYFTEMKGGRLSPSLELRPFVSDVAEVLRGTVHDRNLYLSTSAYPMANKILLDCNDFDTLLVLLNHTLYKPEVNTTRLYDFALKSLLKENPSEKSIDVILSFVGDIVKASIPLYASTLLLDAMERLTTSKIKSTLKLSDFSTSPSIYTDNESVLLRGVVPKRGSDVHEIVRAHLILRLFNGGRKLLSPCLPNRAYNIVALAFKKANLPFMTLNLYRLVQESGIDDKALRNTITYTLARSSEHWDVAIEILEDMRKTMGGISDRSMYFSAFTACDYGRDWEQAIFLLNRMQEDGHSLCTVSVTSVITACAACGQADEALRLLHMMEDKDIVRTVWTYNAAISACAKSGNWKGALGIFEKMRVNSLENKEASSAMKAEEGPAILASGSLEDEKSDGVYSQVEENITDSCDLNEEFEDETDNEDDVEEEEEEEEEEEGWDESHNSNFDITLGTGDYEVREAKLEGVEEVGLFHAMRGVANKVTYNTLIEALGEGGQVILVDELYREAVENSIVNPLSDFDKGWIDLHGHSVHMAKAAIRFSFESLLTTERKTTSHQKGVSVIVGKGAKLVTAIQRVLAEDFHPSIRSHVSQINSGRILLSAVDIEKWLSIHRSLR